MTVLALTLPTARRSAIVVPRRDIVATVSDTLNLQMTLVTTDTPDAIPLDLVGIGPRVWVALWAAPRMFCDYGQPYQQSWVVWSAYAQPVAGVPGRVDVTLPLRSLYCPSGVLGWAVHLNYRGSMSCIAQGALHAVWVAAIPDAGPLALLYSPVTPVLFNATTTIQVQ